MRGAEIKQLIHDSGLKLWQVAELWGLNDSNFSRRLRKPFDEKEVERVKEIINKIKNEQGGLENE